MVPVLKKLNVWTLYMHIVAQVNHRSLWVKVETNCLKDSDLISALISENNPFNV